MNQKRGKMLVAGKPNDHYYGTRRFKIFSSIGLEMIWIVIVPGYLLLGGDIVQFMPVAAVMMFAFFFVVDVRGIEEDAIFEKGVSNSETILTESLTSRGFQPFDEVSIIGVLTHPARGWEGLLLLAGPNQEWRLRPFWDRFEGDFYERLESTLKEKCPSARWVFIPWDERFMRKRRMSWKESRESHRSGEDSEA